LSSYEIIYNRFFYLQEETTKICKEASESLDAKCGFLCFKNEFHILDKCMSFQNTSNKILVNLKTEKEKVFELINNQEQNDYTKQKRSLPNKIGEIVNILFGEINLRDAYKLYSDIKSMIKNGKKSQNSVDNKLIITPANTNEAVVTNPTMTEASIEIQNNVRRIHHHTNNNGEEFSDVAEHCSARDTIPDPLITIIIGFWVKQVIIKFCLITVKSQEFDDNNL